MIATTGFLYTLLISPLYFEETGGSAGVSSPQNAGETASEGKTGSAAARNDTMSKIEKFGKFMDKFS